MDFQIRSRGKAQNGQTKEELREMIDEEAGRS